MYVFVLLCIFWGGILVLFRRGERQKVYVCHLEQKVPSH